MKTVLTWAATRFLEENKSDAEGPVLSHASPVGVTQWPYGETAEPRLQLESRGQNILQAS